MSEHDNEEVKRLAKQVISLSKGVEYLCITILGCVVAMIALIVVAVMPRSYVDWVATNLSKIAAITMFIAAYLIHKLMKLDHK